MSEMGQTGTSTHQSARSVLPLSTDIVSVSGHFRNVPPANGHRRPGVACPKSAALFRNALKVQFQFRQCAALPILSLSETCSDRA